MEYTERFKAEMCRKLMGPQAMSAGRLAQECGVLQPTLSRWLREAKVAGMRMPKTVPGIVRKRWTPEEKMRVVLAAASAGEQGRGELLRGEGLHDSDLQRFQREFIAGVKPATVKRDASDKKRIKELERDVRRKDRALAEAAALMVLSKKLKAYLEEDEVGDMNEDSGK